MKFDFVEWIKKNRIAMVVLLASLAVLAGLYFVANSNIENYQPAYNSVTAYESAKVLSVLADNSEVSEQFENEIVGNQELLLEVTSGNFKGLSVSASNYLGSLSGTHLKEGDRVIVAMYLSGGEIDSIVVYEIDRLIPIIILIAFFILITVLVGGKKGLQSLVGLVLTVISLIWILFPLLLKGWPSIPTTLLICCIVTVICFILLDGLNQKSICAIMGTIAGLVLAVIFALIAQRMVHVDGMRMGDYVDALLQIKQGGSNLQLRGLLVDGIIVASLGAVMDVAMSIASALYEVKSVNSKLEKKDLIKSGMNIGRDMIGTMTNTLILAIVGSSFITVLYIFTLNLPVKEVVSSTLIATELIHSLASSIGVILSVPLTVAICAVVYTNKKDI